MVEKEKLEAFYERPVITATREMVELEADDILKDADKVDISFLVVGDPLGYVLDIFTNTMRRWLIVFWLQSDHPQRPPAPRPITQHPHLHHPQCLHPHRPRIYWFTNVLIWANAFFTVLHGNVEAG